jgi:hypothetical protein
MAGMEYLIPDEDLPPPGEHVLAFLSGWGWWLAQYCPEVDDWAYQPDAWHFVEIGPCAPSGDVTHWMPMPPAPK